MTFAISAALRPASCPASCPAFRPPLASCRPAGSVGFRFLSLLALVFVLAFARTALANEAFQLIQNGSFETGHPPDPWMQPSHKGRTLIVKGGPDGGPHSGKYQAKLGGSNNEGDRIEQTFSFRRVWLPPL